MTLNLPKDCRVHELVVRGDTRGSLVALESGREVPFPIARVYYIFGTEPGVARGFHAHRALTQMAICVRGSCHMLLDDGRAKANILMNRPDLAVEIPPMVWHEMHDFSPDCVLMVLAGDVYEEADYIRSYAEFISLIAAGANA